MITVESSEAAKYLRTANRMTGKVIPVYNMARLTTKDNRMTISTCNENGMYSAVLPCEGDYDFDLLIDAKRILAIMSNCKGRVKIAVNDFAVNISGAGAEYAVYSTNTEDWPNLDATGEEIPVNADSVSRMLHAIAPVRNATGDARAHIAGFLVDSSGGNIRLTTTDSSRLHSVTGTDGYTGKKVIVNKASIPALQQIHGIKSLSVGGSYVVVTGESESLTVRLLEGSFPVIDDMLTGYQQEGYQKVTFDRAAVVEALDRAAVLSDTGVQMFFADSKLKIVATNPDSGEFMAEISTDNDAFNADVYVNLRYMLDAMHLAEEETVSLYLKDANSPIVIVDESVTVVVMPMRL